MSLHLVQEQSQLFWTHIECGLDRRGLHGAWGTPIFWWSSHAIREWPGLITCSRQLRMRLASSPILLSCRSLGAQRCLALELALAGERQPLGGWLSPGSRFPPLLARGKAPGRGRSLRVGWILVRQFGPSAATVLRLASPFRRTSLNCLTGCSRLLGTSTPSALPTQLPSLLSISSPG